MHRPIALAMMALCVALSVHGQVTADAAPRIRDDEYASWTGRRIIEESENRHQQFPYVYEEQTMVLMDSDGDRTVRRLRRFSRADGGGRFKLLLVFDDPPEIRGVALLAARHEDGRIEHGVYLPAFGPQFKRPRGSGAGGNFLGTDFAVEDLTAESLDDHRYVRGNDRVLEDVEFFVVEAYPRDARIERRHGYGLRRHLVRKDNFVIVQTDFFDRRLRYRKRLTRHDLRQVDGPSWRANMIMMSDRRDDHRTLLKVDRRVYSRDYVPEELFDPPKLLEKGVSGELTARSEP